MQLFHTQYVARCWNIGLFCVRFFNKVGKFRKHGELVILEKIKHGTDCMQFAKMFNGVRAVQKCNRHRISKTP